MQIGMIGLGRMGANMVRRLMRAGHECVAFDVHAAAVDELKRDGAHAAYTLEQLVESLRPPRAVWMMVPAAVVGDTIERVAPLLGRGDILVDGGNSDYRRAREHSEKLKAHGIDFVDAGVSGGVWGLENGYCLMIGGNGDAVARLQPVLEALAPAPLATDQGAPVRGYLHCGPAGAGHFVKMVHNGVEYALMAAYAEGFNLLAHAGSDSLHRKPDAETAPVDDASAYHYDFDVPAIAQLWRNGSVVRSWLLDLTAQALSEDPALERYEGRVADSGEGRWTLKAAIDLSVPVPTLANALFARFSSRDEDAFANRLLSAMREQFGGHTERKTPVR
jgi:6-phosphogluconate dehydrogenase